jgi:peptidyl-prolyl cis-trans isomerase C
VAIPHAAIAREAQHHPAAEPQAAWHAAARALVVRELLLQEARRLRIEASPQSDESGRRETEEEALIRGGVEQEVKTPEPDEATCRRYYEQNRARFRSPAIYEAAHILFAADEEDARAWSRAQSEGGAALAELKQRPERFAQLARLHSACPSAAHGGNLGQITAGQTAAAFERALLALRPGEMYREPVRTRYGFHVIRLDRKIEGQQLPFGTVADRIAAYLRDSVGHRAAAQYVARLISRATISGIALDGTDAHRVN